MTLVEILGWTTVVGTVLAMPQLVRQDSQHRGPVSRVADRAVLSIA